MHDRAYFVYLMQSTSRRVLYTGVTNNIVARAVQHQTAKYPDSFTARYHVTRLVYYEEFADAASAHVREKQIKGWTRARKNALVESMNPHWRDLLTEWEKKYRLDTRPTPTAFGKRPIQTFDN